MRLRSVGCLYAGFLAAGAVLPVELARADTQARGAVPVRGVVRAVSQAAIATDLPTRVVTLHFKEAQAFKKGDTLVTFDCERLTAEHAAAEAVHREMRLGFESQSYLEKRGAVGKLDIEVSRARVDKARAEAAAIAVRLKQCTLVAPFDGRIVDLKVNEHEFPPNGQPFISLTSEGNFEIDLIVPSNWLRTLTVDTALTFAVDETGLTYEAKVLRIGAAVDPVSQTVKVIAGFAVAAPGVLPGMSGSATVPGMQVAR